MNKEIKEKILSVLKDERPVHRINIFKNEEILRIQIVNTTFVRSLDLSFTGDVKYIREILDKKFPDNYFYEKDMEEVDIYSTFTDVYSEMYLW